MGLDIFFYKLSGVRKSKDERLKSVKLYYKLKDELARDKFRKFADETLQTLKGLSGKEYEDFYNEIFPDLMDDFTHYDITYNAMCGEVKPYGDVKDFFDAFAESYFKEDDVYFRKVNFLYKFFKHKLRGEICIVSKDDLDKLISRCEEVLEDNSKAEKLLPTQSGFFFGSTEYDNWYFDDVRDVLVRMKLLRESYDEDKDVIIVEMNW